MIEDRREWDPFAPAPDEKPKPAAPVVEVPDPRSAADLIPADVDDITLKDLKALAELAGVATYGSKHDVAERIRAAVE